MPETARATALAELDHLLSQLEQSGTASKHDLAVLCDALHHRDRRVALKVARALGRYGDESAIQPLTTLLRDQLLWSGRLIIVCGLMLVGFTLLTIGWALVADSVTDRVLLLLILIVSFQDLYRDNRRRGAAARVLSEALADLSERVEIPELWKVAPDLRRVSRDVIQQSPATRRGFRAAAHRIDRSTRELKSLPIAAGASRAEAHQLPRPAAAPGEPTAGDHRR